VRLLHTLHTAPESTWEIVSMWQPFAGYRRANGVAVLLGTQNPKDVNPVILNYVR